MEAIIRQAIDFLCAYEMDHHDIDFDDHIKRFLREMEAGLAGLPSSLEMIPTYLQAVNQIPVGRRVIAADAGGTNVRVAAVYFDENKKPVIENLRTFSMPAVESELSRIAFFDAMAGYFAGVLDASEKIGFCFSYPTEITANRDGRLIRFAKEIKAPEVVGQMVGENLNLAIGRLGLGGAKHIVLLNDTVAALLSGVGFQNRQYSSYIGFILGTGTNCAYIESNANIAKQEGLDPRQSQIINTESGGMAKAHWGQIDRQFDASTTNPGVHFFEKMISGAYLGPLFLTVLHRACRDGLLSGGAAKAIGQLSDLSTKQMNAFMLYPCGSNPLAGALAGGTSQDAVLAYVIADRLVERAAKLAAVNLSAMAVKCGQGTNPACPICIVAEGTTFYQMKTLKSRVEFYLKQHLENQRGIYTEIIGVEHAALIGAAIAGLTN
ncbi:MAG: hexokinase [Phycisphaerae bacterium]|nr:hexokinase [Phycisphaerae bacterium]